MSPKQVLPLSVNDEALERIRRERVYTEKVMTTISDVITSLIYVFLLIAMATTINGKLNYYQKHQTDKLLQARVNKLTYKKCKDGIECLSLHRIQVLSTNGCFLKNKIKK